VLGNTSFLKYINNNIDELRRKTRPNFRIGMDELISEISKKNNLKIIDLKSMGGERAVSRARAVFSYISHVYCGYKIIDIATFLKKDPSAVTHAIKKIKAGKRPNELREVRSLVKKFKNSRPVL
jgi:chromosomal replication initiation ATPase DnaA